MRKYSALLLLAAACGTDGTTPTASGVFPAEGFTGRSLRVEISGDATTWKDGATVDFGTGITVNAVDVASPTDLFADITIDPAAAVGKNDVTVTNNGKKYTLAKAFELVSPTPITWSGDVAQGGVPFFTIENLDFAHQFDATQDPNTNEYLNTQVTGPAGTRAVLTSVTPFEIQGELFIDVNAAATSAPLTVVSGTSSATSFTSIPGNVDLKARSPMAFTGSATVSLAEKGSSQLFSIAGSGPTLVRYTLAGNSADSSPVSEVMGAGGTWASDAIGASPAVIEGGNGFLLVESFGTAPDTVTLTGAAEALTSAAEVTTANDTFQNAQAFTGVPLRMTGASISADADVDYVKFTAPASAMGKHLHVNTDTGTDPQTDTAVTITTGTGSTAWEPIHDDGANCSFFGCDGGEDFTTTATLTAGNTYYLRIEKGANYSTSDKDYVLLVWIE